MTTLRNSTLTASGKVFIKGNLTSTLRNATLSSSVAGRYYANLYINEYLVGKGLVSYFQDYRGYYYKTTSQLQTAINEIPVWMLIEYSYPPI